MNENLASAVASGGDGSEAAAGSAPMLQFLRLAAGGEHYALRVDAVREILEVAKTTPLPLMPSFVRGVMNLRGAVVPVIDLGARLGLQPTVMGRRTCVVIVDVSTGADEPSQRLGMLVDAVFEVFDAAGDSLEPVPRLGTRVDPAFLRGITRVRGRATPELDVNAVLDPEVLSGLISAHMTLH